MRIKVKKIKYETVELSDDQVREITLDYLYSVLGSKGYYISKHNGQDWVTYWEDTHGSGITDHIRKATKKDKLVYETICMIKDLDKK